MKRSSLLIFITLITLLASYNGRAQNLLSEGFEGATFPPTGWQNNLIVNNGTDISGGSLVWQQATAGTLLPPNSNTGDPNSGVAHTGSHSAGWNAWDIGNGGTADLVTPVINLASYPGGTNTLTFWSYRNYSDPIYVYVNTNPNVTGGTLLVTLNSTQTTWAQSSVTIPASYTGNVYIIFHAVSSYEYDEFIDDVSVDHVGCSGTPSAPSITNAPLGAPACSGNTITLSASDPNSVPGITTTWQQSASATGPWVTVIGGNGAATLNYTTPALSTSMYYRYYDSCTYSHTANASAAYYVPVNASTIISAQPQASTICAGVNTAFTVAATGTNLFYQWQVNTGGGFNGITNGGVYSNATSPTLNISGPTTAMNAYQYRVVVTGSCGILTSNTALLTVGQPPTINTQPHDSTLCAGNNATFSVAATGASLSYQWLVNTGSGFHNVSTTSPYSGGTTNTLTVAGAPASMNGYQYQVVVSGACSPATSNTVTLHVNALPTIVTQPSNITACNGTNPTFTVNATGSGLLYQWQVNTGSGFSNVSNPTLYTGANTNALTINGASLSMNGYRYRAIISGICAPIDTTVTDTLKVNPIPLIGITALGNTTICPSDSVSFAGVAATGVTYQWYLNGTAIPGAVRDTFKANPVGAYKIAITNSLGCVSVSSSDTVKYLPAPASVISPSGPTSFCVGSSVTLNATTPLPGLTYYWKKNGLYISNALTSSYSATVSGTYNLYENDGTCGTLSPPVTVTANAIPPATIATNGPATFCTGSSLTLYADTATGYTYQWSYNGNPQASGTGSTYTASAAGNYTVEVFSNPGCYNTSSTLLVSALTTPTAVALPAGNTSICPGASAVLNANSVANATYQWKLNGSALSGATYTTYTAATGGSYTVSIGAGNGCVGTSAPVVITSLPAVTASITSNGSDTSCTAGSIILTAPAGTGLSYQWYDGTTALSSTTNTLPIQSTGNYSVTVSNAGCSATSSAVHVAVGTTPTGNIGYAPPGAICGSAGVLLQAPTGTGYTYQWYYSNSPITGAATQYYEATVPGGYTVQISTPLGCSYTTAAAPISQGTIPSPSISPAGTQLCATGYTAYQWNFNNQPMVGATSSCINPPQVGGYTVTVTNSTGCSATSDPYTVTTVSSAANIKPGSDDIKLYPNPASSVIYIDAPLPVNITVMSIEGKLLMNATRARFVNLDGFANGMYLISVYDQDEHLLKTEKVVKD